jgi:hypothetical protein
MELLEDSAPARSVEEGGGSGSLDARRAAGDSKSEAALDGVEVGVFGERELQLVSEGRSGGSVGEGPGG